LEDGASDFFGLLACWRRLGHGRSNEMISIHYGDLQLDLVHEGGAPLRAALTAILETSTERGAVRRVWRSLRTRERRAEWLVGGPRARESCFGLGVLHAVWWSVWVQQHYDDGSCTTVAHSVWWCLPSYSFVCGGLHFNGFGY
jgi:hypothetical protein